MSAIHSRIPRVAVRLAVVLCLLPVALPAQGSAAERSASQVTATRRAVPAATRTVAGTIDTTTLTSRGSEAAPTVNIPREIFSYSGAGRRDPYTSLMTNGDLRPLVSDLRLTAVAFDPLGRNSVAILRDIASAQQYRVRVGQTVGRMRIASIRQKAVIFSIEEFGFSRQETLPLTSDSTTTRTR